MNKPNYKDSLYYRFVHSEGMEGDYIHRIVSNSFRKQRIKSVSAKNNETWIQMPKWMNELNGTDISPLEINLNNDNVMYFNYLSIEGKNCILWVEEQLDKSMYKFLHSQQMPEIETEADKLLLEIIKR